LVDLPTEKIKFVRKRKKLVRTMGASLKGEGAFLENIKMASIVSALMFELLIMFFAARSAFFTILELFFIGSNFFI